MGVIFSNKKQVGFNGFVLNSRRKGEIVFFCHNSHLPKGTVINRQSSVKTFYCLLIGVIRLRLFHLD